MGASMSTLGGWAVIFLIFGYVRYSTTRTKRLRETQRTAAAQRLRNEDRQSQQARKDAEKKAKRQRLEAHSKDAEDLDKAAKSKARAPKAAPVATQATNDDSSDDGVDNREFARQLASIKAGTNLNTPKKAEEKRQKSVKQSRARVIEDKAEIKPVSAPSSTAGADADDDESSAASPEVTAADSAGIADMLESKASGLSVLRLTDTDKVKQKAAKAAKAPEKTETKKQRQNRLKAEAAKVAREDAEKERKVALEAQRRLARVSEGRAAKDGSAFMASQAAQSAWSGSATNGTAGSVTNGDSEPVQPLDTFENISYSEVASPPKASPEVPSKPDSWITSLPSEEEQLELLRGEEAWNTVKTKKTTKGKKSGAATEGTAEAERQPLQAAPVVSQPVAPKTSAVNGSSRPTKSLYQQSSFAALGTNDDDDAEVENEWDV
ncbi:hypothetical protein B0T17DRAFT_486923 [Bombardia bombarda]|uniref:Uncharacterized protein n=1 Tax=Bombardia bombarda TaxID=252184 RepID=A0AA39XAK7_9PEZI|nr:hypothetical protein B0T17DRAFT_486923 [Bombardia bombarda]